MLGEVAEVALCMFLCKSNVDEEPEAQGFTLRVKVQLTGRRPLRLLVVSASWPRLRPAVPGCHC